MDLLTQPMHRPIDAITSIGDWAAPPALDWSTPEELVRPAGHAGRLLPANVHDHLVDFTDDPGPAGALLIRGVPVGEVGPTPPSPTAAGWGETTAAFSLLTVARRLGQPVGYLPEFGGSIIQHICPVAASADRQVSTSSKVDLMFHTEAAFHPHRPRYLLLLCLRGDRDGLAETTLSSVREIAPLLPDAVRSVLFERRFRTLPDESYLNGAPGRPSEPMSVLSGTWDQPALVFDLELMVGLDDEAQSALGCLADLVSTHQTGAVLEAGDLLVVDNTVAVHGRSAYRPRFDGLDRWLMRSFVVSDLLPSAGERVGRVIATRFEAA